MRFITEWPPLVLRDAAFHIQKPKCNIGNLKDCYVSGNFIYKLSDVFLFVQTTFFYFIIMIKLQNPHLKFDNLYLSN